MATSMISLFRFESQKNISFCLGEHNEENNDNDKESDSENDFFTEFFVTNFSPQFTKINFIDYRLLNFNKFHTYFQEILTPPPRS
jgi:hypothetical protein